MEQLIALLPTDPTFWVAVSFSIFVLVFLWKGRGAMVGMIDKNINAIKKQLTDAAMMKKEAQDILATANKKLRDAEKMAKDIMDASREDGERLLATANEKLQQQLAQKEKQLTERLAQDEARLKNQFIKEVSAEAIAMAQTHLSASLQKGQKKSDDAIKSAVKKIERLQ